MSTDTLEPIFLLVFYLTLILLELNSPMKITFMEWLEVPNSRYHCSQDSEVIFFRSVSNSVGQSSFRDIQRRFMRKTINGIPQHHL